MAAAIELKSDHGADNLTAESPRDDRIHNVIRIGSIVTMQAI
jgi:hypothetical protein